MLLEFLTWATSKSCPAARKAGLVAEVAGIVGRYKRHRTVWEPHLNETKAFIRANIEKAEADKPILVLGAGILLDLPLSTLAKHKGGVVLVDAVVSLFARLKMRNHPNISFKCKDLTGFLETFWNSKEGDALTPPYTAPLPDGDFGMVISCNILSQLPLSFANCPPQGDTEMQLYSAIQLAHMRALEKYSCPILLISDYEREETSSANTEIITAVPPQILPGEPHKKWQWYIAPEGEVRPGLDVKLNVGAWLLSSL